MATNIPRNILKLMEQKDFEGLREKSQGIRHEYLIRKTPQKNGVAERIKKTLVETTRSMLSDFSLPKKI